MPILLGPIGPTHYRAEVIILYCSHGSNVSRRCFEGVGPPFRRAAIPKSPPFRKPSFGVLRGIVLDIVSYYLAIGIRATRDHPPRFQKSPFTFPMLHKQLVMIAYLTVCLSLSRRIRLLYPLDFGVFLLFCS